MVVMLPTVFTRQIHGFKFTRKNTKLQSAFSRLRSKEGSYLKKLLQTYLIYSYQEPDQVLMRQKNLYTELQRMLGKDGSDVENQFKERFRFPVSSWFVVTDPSPFIERFGRDDHYRAVSSAFDNIKTVSSDELFADEDRYFKRRKHTGGVLTVLPPAMTNRDAKVSGFDARISSFIEKLSKSVFTKENVYVHILQMVKCGSATYIKDLRKLCFLEHKEAPFYPNELEVKNANIDPIVSRTFKVDSLSNAAIEKIHLRELREETFEQRGRVPINLVTLTELAIQLFSNEYLKDKQPEFMIKKILYKQRKDFYTGDDITMNLIYDNSERCVVVIPSEKPGESPGFQCVIKMARLKAKTVNLLDGTEETVYEEEEGAKKDEDEDN